MNKFCAVLFVTLLICDSSHSYACEKISGSDTPVLVFPPKFNLVNPEQGYVFQLLQLVLDKASDKFGPCEAQLLPNKLPLKRIESYLASNQVIHAASLTVNQERDKRFLPVPVPISKGLNGYRLLLVRDQHLQEFSNINNVKDLSKRKAGLGVGWSDVDVLRHSGLPVVTTGSRDTLIEMLIYDRFDYLPFGALQRMTINTTPEEHSLVIEPRLILVYPSMTAFYVNVTNVKLADRLAYGLEKLFNDGSFEQFFNTHPVSARAIKNINITQRLALTICNPILPSWVPLKEDKYWYKPWTKNIIARACQYH